MACYILFLQVTFLFNHFLIVNHYFINFCLLINVYLMQIVDIDLAAFLDIVSRDHDKIYDMMFPSLNQFVPH